MAQSVTRRCSLNPDGSVASEQQIAVNGVAVPISFHIGEISDKNCSLKVVDASGIDIHDNVSKFIIYDDARYTYVYATKLLLSGNDWKGVFTGIKECDNRGFPIEYSVVEESVLGYTASYGKLTDGTLTVENTEVDGIDVEKIWDTDGETALPESIKVHLLQNGNRYKELTLTADTNWRGRFEGISWRDASGKLYDYTIEEEDLAGFEGRVAFDVYDYKATVTNVPTTQVDVVKIWEGDEAHVAERPESITAILMRDAAETVSLGQSDTLDDWGAVFTNAYAANVALHGAPAKITYRLTNDSDSEQIVKMIGIRGMAPYSYYATLAPHSTINGIFAFPNLTDEPNIKWSFASINEWDDSLANAVAAGEVYGTITMEFTEEIATAQVLASDDWKTSFTELPTKDARGNVYSYRVVEDDIPEGYVSHVNVVDGKTVITNTYGKIDIPVEKVWVDLDNRDKIRSSSVEIELIANGEPTGKKLTLSSANEWKGAFTKIDPTDEEGNAIVYEVRENDIPTGYNCNISGDAENGFVVENSHDCKTGIKITKVWDDNQDTLHKRPMFITVHVFGDGEEVVSGKIQGSGDVWEMVFQDLPYVAKDGHVIEYTVSEEAVDGYTMTSLTGNGEDGYIITNWTEQPEYELPLSGSSSLAIMTLIGGILLIGLGISSTRKIRRENKVRKQLMEWQKKNNKK